MNGVPAKPWVIFAHVCRGARERGPRIVTEIDFTQMIDSPVMRRASHQHMSAVPLRRGKTAVALMIGRSLWTVLPCTARNAGANASALSMVSYRSDGRSFDRSGVQPDVLREPAAD